MEILQNLSFIEAATEQLIGSKNSTYNITSIYQQVSKYANLKCEVKQIKCQINHSNQLFNIYFISHRQFQRQPCIIYLHGLSSYSFQGQFLLPFLEDSFSLCLYDLRSHGRNKNQLVTYGVKETEDLYQLINNLINQGITEIYLWGRSMGASTILNFLSKHGNENIIKKSVKYTILDSPFSSFQQIAKQTICRSINLPYLISSPLINIAMSKIEQKTKINLKKLNFTNLCKIYYPSVFIYSQNDQIVNSYHSVKIIEGYAGNVKILKGQFKHNQVRPINLIQNAMNIMKENSIQVNKNQTKTKISLIKSLINSKKGLSISLIPSKNIIQEKQNINILNTKQDRRIMTKVHLKNKVNPYYNQFYINQDSLDINKYDSNNHQIYDHKNHNKSVNEKLSLSPKLHNANYNKSSTKIEIVSNILRKEVKTLNSRRNRVMTYELMKQKQNMETYKYNPSQSKSRSKSKSKNKSNFKQYVQQCNKLSSNKYLKANEENQERKIVHPIILTNRRYM